MSYFLGIDLGTTYTAAAVWRDGRAEVASLGGRAPVIPSVVLLREDGEILTGEAAERRAVSEPHRIAREFKRRIGDPTPLIVAGRPCSADALTARLLRAVVSRVFQQEHRMPAGIGLSHPANWGNYKKDLLRQAVEQADLGDVALVSEPEAAAIHYASQAQERVEVGSVIAVYDLGGGTFDAAVLRRARSGWELLGQPEGIERLGGVDFNQAVFEHVVSVLGPAYDGLDPDDPTAHAAVTRLRQECVEAKEALAADTDVTIPVLLPTVHTEVRLTRVEFEDMIRPALGDSIAALQRALRSARVANDEVSAVLLVGGSSRIPLVGQMVGAAFARPIAIDAHPKHSVALGAAIIAADRASPGALDTSEVAPVEDATPAAATFWTVPSTVPAPPSPPLPAPAIRPSPPWHSPPPTPPPGTPVLPAPATAGWSSPPLPDWPDDPAGTNAGWPSLPPPEWPHPEPPGPPTRSPRTGTNLASSSPPLPDWPDQPGPLAAPTLGSPSPPPPDWPDHAGLVATPRHSTSPPRPEWPGQPPHPDNPATARRSRSARRAEWLEHPATPASGSPVVPGTSLGSAAAGTNGGPGLPEWPWSPPQPPLPEGPWSPGPSSAAHRLVSAPEDAPAGADAGAADDAADAEEAEQRRRRAMATLIGGAVALVVALTGMVVAGGDDEERPTPGDPGGIPANMSPDDLTPGRAERSTSSGPGSTTTVLAEVAVPTNSVTRPPSTTLTTTTTTESTTTSTSTTTTEATTTTTTDPEPTTTSSVPPGGAANA